MLQLFIDTSTEKSFIGLALKGDLIEQVNLPVGLQNSKFLFSHLLKLLEKHHLTPKDLQLIGCGIGPGSFTGIRVGVATAQSMAYSLRLPLVGICSLQSYRSLTVGPFAVIFDARCGGIYQIKGSFDGLSTSFEKNSEVIPLDKVNLQGLSVVTPHLKELKEKILARFEEGEPSGELFAKQIEDYYQQKLYTMKADLKLLYLRKTQAEMEKEQLRERDF